MKKILFFAIIVLLANTKTLFAQQHSAPVQYVKVTVAPYYYTQNDTEAPYLAVNQKTNVLVLIVPDTSTPKHTHVEYNNGVTATVGDGEIVYSVTYNNTVFRWKKIGDKEPVPINDNQLVAVN